MVVNELIEEIEQKLEETPCNQCTSACNNNCSKHCANQCLEYLSRQIPNYSRCSRLRWQYILRYYWSHYREIEYLLDAQKRNIHGYLGNSNNHYQIESIGGGPGSDLLAASQWLCAFPTEFVVEKLSIWHLDVVDDWLDSLNLLFTKCWLERNDEAVKAKRLHGNALDHSPMDDTNIILASYIMSELFINNSHEETKNWLARLLTNTSSTRRVVVINDRPENVLVEILKATISDLMIQKSNFFFYRFDDYVSENVVNHINKHINCHIPNEKQTKYKTKTTCKSFQAIVYI